MQDRLVPAAAQLVGQRLGDAGQLIGGDRDPHRSLQWSDARGGEGLANVERLARRLRAPLVVAAGAQQPLRPYARMSSISGSRAWPFS